MKTALLWDIFCRVVDNYGDIGVCWRLAADLASRGQQVRLWVDDCSALQWMAPGALKGSWEGIQVMPWQSAHDQRLLAGLSPGHVWVEGFGCDIAPEFIAHRFTQATLSGRHRALPPVWLNLEYLSAEVFVERLHGLPSPVMQGPAKGIAKHFFYPGFTAKTGGLLRERSLAQQQAGFDRCAWLSSHGIHCKNERLISLFCYEPAALSELMAMLARDTRPTRVLVTPGRATAAVCRVLGRDANTSSPAGAIQVSDVLGVNFLPPLSQTGYDRLLWSCDLNFVRGEDSLVRALWARKPFVWQIYPQDDDVHIGKLEALLDILRAPASWRRFHLAWNGVSPHPLAPPAWREWQAATDLALNQLLKQDDLVTRLLAFAQRQQEADGIPPQKS